METVPPHPQCTDKQSSRTGRIPKLIHLREHTHTQGYSHECPSTGAFFRQDTLQRGFTNSNFPSTYKHQVLDTDRIPPRAFRSIQPGTRAGCPPGHTPFPLPRSNLSMSLCAQHSTLESLTTPNIHVHMVHPSRRSLRRSPPPTRHTSPTYTHSHHSPRRHTSGRPGGHRLRRRSGHSRDARPRDRRSTGLKDASQTASLLGTESGFWSTWLSEICIAQMGPGGCGPAYPRGWFPR